MAVFRYPSGEGYSGQWRDGWRHGKGVQYFANGEEDDSERRTQRRWEGSFEQDKAHGVGTMYNIVSAKQSTGDSDCAAAKVSVEYIHGKPIE